MSPANEPSSAADLTAAVIAVQSARVFALALRQPAAALLIVDGQAGCFVAGQYGPPELTLCGADVLAELSHAMAGRDAPLTIDAADADGLPATRRFLRTVACRALLVAPVREGGATVAILLAVARRRPPFTRAEQVVARAVADEAGLTLAGIRLLQAERSERRRTEALLTVAQAVTGSSDLQTALARICRAAAEFSASGWCSILLYDARTGWATPATAWNAARGSNPLAAEAVRIRAREHLQRLPPAPLVIERIGRGEPLIVEDTAASDLIPREWVAAFDLRSLALYPMTEGGRAIGVLCVSARGERVHFPAAEVEAMRTIAMQAAIVIEHLRLQEQVREQAIRDGLTGLHNHRYLKERLEQEVKRSRRTNRPLSIALFDIDDFKRLNDGHGHIAGDVALRRVAAALRRALRAEDVLGRYGGDEFLVLLPETGTAATENLCHRLLAEIAQSSATSGDEMALTASLGIATMPADGETPDALLAAADAAMYAAKRRGGDGLTLAGD